MNKIQNDEIDLIEMFQSLWHGKWIISSFVAIAIVLASGFLLIKDDVYVSKLFYNVEKTPPFFTYDEISNNFQNRFYSAIVFNEWKKVNSKSALSFEDFSTTKFVNGFIISKDKSEQLALLEQEGNEGFFVLVKTDQLAVLDEFFNYTLHINRILTDEYVIRAHKDLDIIKSYSNTLGLADEDSMSLVISIDRYIESAENGQKVFSIYPPTNPKKVSPNTSLTLAIATVFGGIIGVLFLFVRNVLKARNQLSK